MTPADLAEFIDLTEAKATAMIEDAVATAALDAPCILDPEFPHWRAARAIIRAAILRWADSGSGALSSQTAGPFGVTVDTRTVRKDIFTDAETARLKGMCAASGGGSGRRVRQASCL